MTNRYLFYLAIWLSASGCSAGVTVSSDFASLNDNDAAGLINHDSSITTDDTAEVQVPQSEPPGSNLAPEGLQVPPVAADSLQDSSQDVATEPTPPSPVYSFTLSAEKQRRSLIEGDSTGKRFTITASPDGLEPIELTVRAQSELDEKDLSIDVAESQLNRNNNSTTITFTLPVGLQPRLEHERRFEVIARSGDEVRSLELVLDIKPVEVPDVYLLIGQSNMVGRTGDNSKDAGEGGLDQTHPRIRQLNVRRNSFSLFQTPDDFSDPDLAATSPRFIRAQDPLHEPLRSGNDSKIGTTIGPGLSFAKAALASTTQNIFLVPAAWESSGFCRNDSADEALAWNASETDNPSLGGSGLLDRALIRLRLTMRDTNGIFRGILWQQGETDSETRACAESYEQNLRLMVERIRREARVDGRGESARGSQAAIPFIVATQSRGADERGDYSQWNSDKQQVDAVHRNIASVVPFSDYVNNDDLLPPAYSCGSTGCIHFGAEASRKIGRRFFAAMERVWQAAGD